MAHWGLLSSDCLRTYIKPLHRFTAVNFPNEGIMVWASWQNGGGARWWESLWEIMPGSCWYVCGGLCLAQAVMYNPPRLEISPSVTVIWLTVIPFFLSWFFLPPCTMYMSWLTLHVRHLITVCYNYTRWWVANWQHLFSFLQIARCISQRVAISLSVAWPVPLSNNLFVLTKNTRKPIWMCTLTQG